MEDPTGHLIGEVPCSAASVVFPPDEIAERVEPACNHVRRVVGLTIFGEPYTLKL